MTTFITGAITPLGRVLVHELVRQGEAVRLLIPPEANRAGLELPGVAFVRGVITDGVTVRKGVTGCDRICHLLDLPDGGAAPYWTRLYQEGTRHVMQAALDLRVASVVQVSSAAVLTPTQPDLPDPADEEQPLTDAPATLAATVHLAADAVAHDFVDKGVPVKYVYPGLGYGYVRAPSHGGAAEATLQRLAAGHPAIIPGSPHLRLPLTYFRDTAQGITLAHERGQRGDGYLLVGESVTWAAMWQQVADVLGKSVSPRRMPLWWARMTGALPPLLLDWAGRDWHFANDKARQELGWRPQTLRDGMAATWEEYQAQSWGARSAAPVRAMRRA